MNRRFAVEVFVLLVALTCVASAAPLKMRRQPHRFVVGAKDMTRNGWKAIGRSLPMNGGVLTLGAYYATISVGTGDGMVSFDAIVDTGSSNTAVPSSGCTTCGATTSYNATLSPTSVPLACGDAMCQNCAPTAVGSTQVPAYSNTSVCAYGPAECSPVSRQCKFSISYGGSSTFTAGTTVRDVVCIAGYCAEAYVNQFEGQYPSATQPTGIIGLAFPANACNPTCQPTLLDALVAGGQLPPQSNLFGMCLTGANGGLIDFGTVNASRFYGTVAYTPIVSQKWFNIEVRDIEIGGVSIGVPAFAYQIRNDAIGSFVDSGTGTVLVSPYVYSVIQSVFLSTYGTLPGVQVLFSLQGSQCTAFANATIDIAQFPPISFVLAGSNGAEDFRVTMRGSDYVMPVMLPENANTMYCLGIQGVASIGVILGDIIMQNYYIVFDRVNSQLGFAPIRSC